MLFLLNNMFENHNRVTYASYLLLLIIMCSTCILIFRHFNIAQLQMRVNLPQINIQTTNCGSSHIQLLTFYTFENVNSNNYLQNFLFLIKQNKKMLDV